MTCEAWTSPQSSRQPAISRGSRFSRSPGSPSRRVRRPLLFPLSPLRSRRSSSARSLSSSTASATAITATTTSTTTRLYQQGSSSNSHHGDCNTDPPSDDDDPYYDELPAETTTAGGGGGGTAAQLTEEEKSAVGLNELQTLLRKAVEEQNFDDAVVLRDLLADKVSSGAYKPKKKKKKKNQQQQSGQEEENEEEDEEEDLRKMKRLSWKGLGTAPWLIDRLDVLNCKFPTTIQINALEAVNTMLGFLPDSDRAEDEEEDEDETLEERMARVFGTFKKQREGGGGGNRMGVVISGSTGSGKTLAYLVPMLSTLSESLFTRQRIRIKAEEDVGDVAGDILSRIAVATSPMVRRPGSKQVGGFKNDGSGSIEMGAALSTLGKSGTDVKSPLALIVVPTRELGVQIAVLAYQLVGGSVKKSATQMPGLANMFKYKGPKGVRIGCVLDAEEAQHGLKLQTDIAITTPQFLGKLMRDGDIDPSKLRVVIYDEADLALEQSSDEDLKLLFQDREEDRQYSRLTYLVGASVTESLGSLAVRESVLPEGKSFIATATRFAPLTAGDEGTGKPEPTEQGVGVGFGIAKSMNNRNNNDRRAASLKDLGLCLDPGLRHERVVAANDTGLLVLARMLRKELREYEEAVKANSASASVSTDDTNTTAAATNSTTTVATPTSPKASSQIQRPRVVVFFSDEEEARAAIEPLRDAMWGDHKLCVLLPNTGVNPLKIMEQFKSSETSVMLATPNSVRGLDFPALTHVYTLYLPADDPREYLHLAGRVGRIGQMGSVTGKGGRVISILRPEEADKMADLAKTLNFDFVDVEPVTSTFVRVDSDDGAVDEEAKVEEWRRYLEDTITLLKLSDEPDINLDDAEKNRMVGASLGDDDDDDENDDLDDEENIDPTTDKRCDI